MTSVEPLDLQQAANVFGPLVSAVDVEDHLDDLLARWFPTYLWEVERRNRLPAQSLPRIRSVVRSSEIEKFPEDDLPCLMIGSPGLTDPPEADGGGFYTASWRVHLAIEVVAGPNRRALQLARLYTLAIRAAVIQQQADPGLAVAQPRENRTHTLPVVRVDWVDERYDVLDSINDRTVSIGRMELAVVVAEVLRRGQGPLDPMIPPSQPGEPAASWPVAKTVLEDVVRIPITEEP